MRKRRGDWFQTYTGLQFWPFDPLPSEIEIEDIAHALSLQCRFNGHIREFYSVAQHSVLVSAIIESAHARWGLLHDAAEAYIGDMVRPLKIGQPDFRCVEAAVMAAVCARFGLQPEEPPEVKQADDILLMTERRDLLVAPPAPWTPRAQPMDAQIVCWPPGYAKHAFLKRFNELFHGGRTR